MPEIPIAVLDAFRQQVYQLLEASPPLSELGSSGLFSPERYRLIRRETDRLLYAPQLPHGGLTERRMVEKFWRLAARREWAGHMKARMAAEKWVLVDGFYYQRRPLLPKRD